MAKGSRGWFRRKKGSLVFCWYAIRPRDGKKVEQTKVIGPDTMSDVQGWIKVGELGLDKVVGKAKNHDYTIGEVAVAYLAKGTRKDSEAKAESTKDLDKQIVEDYIEPRWGNHVAKDVHPIQVQDWLDVLQGRTCRWNPIENPVSHVGNLPAWPEVQHDPTCVSRHFASAKHSLCVGWTGSGVRNV
jgi:hypothetical protein